MNSLSWTHEGTGRTFTVSGDRALLALRSPRFDRWIRGLPVHLELLDICLTNTVANPGTEKERLIFIHLAATLSDKRTGKPKYHTALLSGDAVACLIVLVCKDDLYALLVKQERLATGSDQTEIVAGMMDDETDPIAKLVAEVSEEAGLVFRRDQTVIFSLTDRPLHSSGGRSDERLHLYAAEVRVTRDELSALSGQVHGAAHEGERTELVVVPLHDVPKVVNNLKGWLAYHLYLKNTF